MNKVKNRQLEMMNLKGVFILLMDYSPVYSPDANMDGIDILGSKDETQTSYLKDDLEVFFLGYPDIFDSDLKKLFENIASQEKENIDYKLLPREITTPSKNTFSFLQKHGNLYNFLTNVLENTSLKQNNVRLLQVGVLDDLMNGFNVYKKIKGANNATDLYICWEIREELFLTYF